MPWGPWIQLENKRVGKWVGASGQGRHFGGAIDDDGSVHITEDELADAWVPNTRGFRSLGETETTPVDATKEVAARNLALTGTGQLQSFNEFTASSVATVAVTPPDSAVYTDASIIASGPAYLNEPDSFHWITEYPDYVGQPFEYHPDDVTPDMGSPSLSSDFGEVLEQWVTLVWNVGEAEADPFFDDLPNISISQVDPASTAQPGVDSGYDSAVEAWPDSGSVSASFVGSAGFPSAVVGDWGVVGIYSLTDRSGLLWRGLNAVIPYLIQTDALLAWSWDVDGTTVREAHFPMFGRIITDFYYRPARFRLWQEGGVVPPLRQYPRDDTLAVGTPRLYPPPQSQQHSPARLDGYI